MKRIVIITDVWNNVNGVVTTIQQVKNILEAQGDVVEIIHPGDFANLPLPSYPEIKVPLSTRAHMLELIDKTKPEFIHIATEGVLGVIARMACIHAGYKFTTSYHTDLPQYIQIRFKAFKETTYKYLHWFHGKSSCVMASTQTLKDLLESRKFKNVSLVPLGVDTKQFKANPKALLPKDFKKPVFAFLGRLAPEKNIPAFLKCQLPGTKLVIGDGPSRQSLEKKYGQTAKFVGYKTGQELIDLLSVSDVLVFPSTTDTFGIVILEAMACGLPVAAFNVLGPKDLITNGVDGYIGPNLEKNALQCLELKSSDCRKKAMQYSIEKWVQNFADHLVPIKN